jgi:small subunit ribosomal protein S7
MVVARLMKHGKKSTAQRILSDAFGLINDRTGSDPLEVFETAVRNSTPLVEVRARRVGGATYQVPMEVRQERGTAMALRWLVNFSRARNGRSMAQKLAGELMDAANEAGSAVRKRENPQDGRGQQGLRPLPLLSTLPGLDGGRLHPDQANP